jgi:hypothetical protein
LVEDIVRDRVNLIPLGESLAMHAAAVVAAQRMGAKQIVNGFTGYQRHLPEQGMGAFTLLSQFIKEYDLTLNSPLLNVESVQQVQYELLQYGLSPKSLEAVSMFADCCEESSDETVIRYIEAKLPILRDFVSRFHV